MLLDKRGLYWRQILHVHEPLAATDASVCCRRVASGLTGAQLALRLQTIRRDVAQRQRRRAPPTRHHMMMHSE